MRKTPDEVKAELVEKWCTENEGTAERDGAMVTCSVDNDELKIDFEGGEYTIDQSQSDKPMKIADMSGFGTSEMRIGDGYRTGIDKKATSGPQVDDSVDLTGERMLLPSGLHSNIDTRIYPP